MEEEIIARSKEQSHLMETIRAAATIKLMGREPERESAWRNLYADVTNAGISVGKYQITAGVVQTLITSLVYVVIVYVAGRLVLAGEGFSVGMLFAFLSFRQTFNDRAIGFINQVTQFRLLGLHLDRLADIVTTMPDPDSVGQNLDVKGAIRVSQVSFRYGATDQLVLENVNFEVRPGDFIAIIGPSGGGKTTLLKLLLGLYPPTSGHIELDGRRADPELWRIWRKRIGFVAQDDRLLSGTIADNIAFFDPDLDMARVEAAAKAAQVHDDIMQTPMQYLGLIGDMGSTLSGGQRQRVLLARALYAHPSVLFLDEGTANLDEETEAAITRLVADMPITRIVVAHRPALIRRAHRVFMLKHHELREVSRAGATEIGAAAEPLALASRRASAGAPAAVAADGSPASNRIGEPLPARSSANQLLETEITQESPQPPLSPEKRSAFAEAAAPSNRSLDTPPRRRLPRARSLAAAVFVLAVGAAAFHSLRDAVMGPRLVTPLTPEAPPSARPQPAPVAQHSEPVTAQLPVGRTAGAPEPKPAEPRKDELPAVPPAPDNLPEQPVATSADTPFAPVPPETSPQPTHLVAPARTVKGTRAASAGESFRDCEKCPELIELPGGTFDMGSGDDATQKPVRKVGVGPFALGRFPVTVGEWRICVEALACTYQPAGDDDEPVHNLSWKDAQQYVGWLSRMTRLKYRLPTEAEWEFAARARTTTRFWWGDQLLPSMANCKGCGEPYVSKAPTKVGSFPANPFGLYDMTGGVWQWVLDCWHPDYQGAPTDGSSWETPNCPERVLRGGSWLNDPRYVSTTTRNRYDADVRYPANGFRVARSR
jgi:formylglycine-generating enzyme required for sulfatase activity/ABC-type lipoprotein export system ATPase subunit